MTARRFPKIGSESVLLAILFYKIYKDNKKNNFDQTLVTPEFTKKKSTVNSQELERDHKYYRKKLRFRDFLRPKRLKQRDREKVPPNQIIRFFFESLSYQNPTALKEKSKRKTKNNVPDRAADHTVLISFSASLLPPSLWPNQFS